MDHLIGCSFNDHLIGCSFNLNHFIGFARFVPITELAAHFVSIVD